MSCKDTCQPQPWCGVSCDLCDPFNGTYLDCSENCGKCNGPAPNPNCDPNDPTTVYQCDFDNCIYNATTALVPFLGKTDRAKDINYIAQFSCGTQPVGKGSKSKLFDIAMQWWNFGLTAVPNNHLKNPTIPPPIVDVSNK